VKLGLKVGGMSGLKTNMRAMSQVTSPQELDAIAEAALEPMKQEVERNAFALRDTSNPNPKGGHLDQGVINGRITGTKRKRVWWTAFHKRARKIAHLVEFGTAPHDQPRRGIRHPGAVAKPFMRKAFEAKKQTVLDIAKLRLLRKIRSVIKN
jgi:HK97 gp10 family phage protein